MTNIFFIIAVTALSSIAGLVGGFLLLWKEYLARRWSLALVSFAAGTLLGAAFLDLLNEAVELSPEPGTLLPYALAGLLLFFLIERSLLFHHHMHREENEIGEEPRDHAVAARRAVIRPLIIFGDAIHNLLDGVIIAATFTISPSLGFVTLLAVFFHELPQEIGDFAILLHSGMRRKRIILWNILGALVSPIGAVIGFYAVDAFRSIELPVLAFAAGGFIYIAGSDLIPEINHESRARNILAHVGLVILGILVIWFVGRIFPE